MYNITIKDILKICNGKLIIGDKNKECINFSTDTRNIQKGDVYIGLKGENFNGSKFYKTALELGASVCVLQDVKIEEDIKNTYTDRAIIIVEDTLKALQQIAKYKRSKYNIPVIAVTGSVGKTSTKDIIASVVSKKYNVLKTEGNYNNHIGVPLTILRLQNHNAMVIEMGMSNLGEISLLTDIAKPTIAVITNIGTAHIGNLGSRQNILKAKLEILEGLSKDGTLIINNDNDMLHNWNKNNKNYNVLDFGIKNKSKIMAQNINITANSTFYELINNNEDSIENSENNIKNIKYNVKYNEKNNIKDNENNVKINENSTKNNENSITYNENSTNSNTKNTSKIKIEIPISSEVFIYNSLSAICVGKLLNIEIEKIKQGIKNFELTKNRMEIKKINEITIINDCYNANFDSMKAAIESLAKIEGKRKIAILGDMLELGDFSKKLHCDIGIEIYKNNIDILITVGEEAKNIAKTAIKSGMNLINVYILNDNKEVINLIKNIKQKDDCILIKASHGMKFNEIVDELQLL